MQATLRELLPEVWTWPWFSERHGYDFNGWILQFFEENCDGMVQIDGQGFYGPEGEILLDLPPIDDEHEKQEAAASGLMSPTPLKQSGQA